MRRLEELGIKPRRSLGQNFLIDNNYLDVMGSLASLSDEDVVLEVGGGLGVLSEYLATRVGHLHVYEVDRRLKPAMEEAVGSRENVSVMYEDAARADFQKLVPVPEKMVSNLPYSVATPVILRAIQLLGSMGLWVVMVQKEIADRLSAAPGGKDYGAPSVLAQLACRVKVMRAVPRTVFTPRPNVDSSIVKLTRIGPWTDEKLRLLIAASFAHRRKALPRSLSTAAESNSELCKVFGSTPSKIREAARGALVEIGESEDSRAERLSPTQFVELAKSLSE